jgi:flagellar basal body-associated protein FliL
MATMTQAYNPQKLSLKRILLGIALFIALLVIAWAVRTHTNQADAPNQSTNQANPNVQQNVPPSGQANQGSDSSQDSTPSANGTNGVDGAGR